MKEEERVLFDLYFTLDKAFNEAWTLSAKHPSDDNWNTFLMVSDVYHRVKEECEKRGIPYGNGKAYSVKK